MLRLPPTRITIDARDIEYHVSNGARSIQDMIAKRVTTHGVFTFPFPPLRPSSIVPLYQNGNSDIHGTGIGIDEQLLRDTVLPPDARHKCNRSSEESLSEKFQNLLSADGQVETTNIITKMEKLHVGQKHSTLDESKSQSTPSPSSNNYRSSLTPQSEPQLPPPFSQTSRSAISRNILPNGFHPGDDGLLAQHTLHASPIAGSPVSPPLYRHFTPPTPDRTVNAYHWVNDNISQQQRPVHVMFSDTSLVTVYSPHPTYHPSQRTPYAFETTARSRNRQWRPRHANRYPGIWPVTIGHSPGAAISTSIESNHEARPTVYNDSLPPESQPQTPHGLPHHGLPYARIYEPWTAPTGRSSRGVSEMPETPTHSRRHRVAPTPVLGIGTPTQLLPSERDQENAAMYAEWNRRRRARAEGIRAIRQGGATLESTPPRDPETIP